MDEILKRAVCQVLTQVPIENNLKTPHLPYGRGPRQLVSGSGFVIDAINVGLPATNSPYLVVTNFHVVNRSVEICIRFRGSSDMIPVIPLTLNPQYDLAILQLKSDTDDFPTDCLRLALGNSRDVKSNTKLYAAGYPLGYPKLQIQQGERTGFHVSAQDIYFQHSAQLNHGNSGGPLAMLNDDPKAPVVVVGVNCAIVRNAQAIDFAITVDRLYWVIDVYRKTNKRLQDAFQLGCRFQHGDSVISQHLLHLQEADIPKRAGVMVSYVHPNDDNIPFQRFDWVTDVDGLKIHQNGTVADPLLESQLAPAIPLDIYLSRLPYASEVEFTVYRHLKSPPKYGAKPYEQRTIALHLVTNPNASPSTSLRKVYLPFQTEDYEILGGMVLSNISENAALEFNRDYRDSGVIVVNMIPQGGVFHNEALKSIVQAGTLLTKINDVPFRSLTELRRIFQKCWQPEEEVVIFETEQHHLIVLLLTELHEDNECISEIYGASASSTYLPHSNVSVAVKAAATQQAPPLRMPVVETDDNYVDDLAIIEKELQQSLGI